MIEVFFFKHPINSTVYNRNITVKKNSNSLLVKTLIHHQLFRGFNEEQVSLIVSSCVIRHLKTGDVLITPGEQNHMLYLVVDGELTVILEKDGTQVSIPIQPGGCLGEMSLVMESPTSALAVAHTESRILVISKATFWSKIALTRLGVKNLMGIMAQRLQRNNYALIREIKEQLKYKQLEKDLETAGKIQSNIVPDGANLFPNRPEIEIYAQMKQAREVGGDFYDAMALDQDLIYIAIGDATGKGMPAALFMMRAFTSLRLLVSNNPLGDVMPSLNRILARNNDDMMFVSLFAGVLDVRNGIFRYVNGGHNPPFAALGGRDFQLLDLPDGPLVGVLDEARFKVAEIKVDPGDTIFLYTDGIPEATNSDQVPFNTDRIQQTLNRLEPPSMKSLVQALESAVDEFTEGTFTHDDRTMLAFCYLGDDS